MCYTIQQKSQVFILNFINFDERKIHSLNRRLAEWLGNFMLDQAGIRMAQGSLIAAERVAGVNDNMSKSHYHDYYELYFLEKGFRHHIEEEQLFHIQKDEFLLFAPYTMHHSYGDVDVPFQRIVLYFRTECGVNETILNAIHTDPGVYRPSKEDLISIHALLNEILITEQSDDIYKEEALSILLNMLLLRILRVKKIVPVSLQHTRITDVINYINEHYNEDITLEKLGNEFFISPYYLCREFKKYTNRTIIQYLNVTRIMKAQRQIMETDKTLTQIALDNGFSNLTHFNRVFKNVTTHTPSSYRKEYKKGCLPRRHPGKKENKEF